MKVFLDANVLVSVFNKEYPVFSYSARILSLADRPGFQLFTSSICLAIAFYFAEKKSGSETAKSKITLLVEKLGIASTDKTIVMKAINDRKVIDFEDGLEYYSALSVGCDYLVTEDVTDFHFSGIPVMTSEQFLIQVVAREW